MLKALAAQEKEVLRMRQREAQTGPRDDLDIEWQALLDAQRSSAEWAAHTSRLILSQMICTRASCRWCSMLLYAVWSKPTQCIDGSNARIVAVCETFSSPAACHVMKGWRGLGGGR